MKMLESKVGLRADRVLAMTAAAAAAATGAGLVGDASMASADLVDSGIVNIVIPDDFVGIYMNLVTGQVGSSDAGTAGWDINPYTAGSSPNGFHLWSPTASWFSSSGVAGGPYPTALGTFVDPAGAYFTPGGNTNVGAQVTLNAANYFGVRFNNEALSATNFGWLEITFGATASDRAITRYVYENSGAGITIGAVPEPTSLSVLALGALGLVARRRRRAM